MEEKSEIRYQMIIMRWGSACLNCGIVLASQSTEFQTSFMAWRLVRLLTLRQTAFDRNTLNSPLLLHLSVANYFEINMPVV